MENLKKRAAIEAVKQIREGMIVGLGTGSTAKYATLKIAELIDQGMEIICIATSQESNRLARGVGIKTSDINEYDKIDITIDGADEIDKNLNLIKGGGGALTREKIVASCSKKLIIVIDESKKVEEFSFPLPVEVVTFGWKRTAEKLRKLDLNPQIRDGLITDNGNFILDCTYKRLNNVKEIEKEINILPGVVENGLFINLADEIIIGKKDLVQVMTK